MNNNNYKIPNLNEGLDLMSPSENAQDDCMLRILQNMNKPKAINESVEPEAKKTATCPECGATWTPEVTMEDGSKQVCPMCDHVCNPESAEDEGGAHVEDEPTVKVNESEDHGDEDKDEQDLEESFKQYMECIDKGDAAGAKAILESIEATAICESVEDGAVDIMLEKFVIKVNSEGKKTKVKVRTKKVRRTPAQKAALRKARKTANKGAAKKKRKKAMKARARMGLTESLRKSRTINAVQKLAESAGVTLDSKALEKAINEAYNLSEAEVMLKDENVLSTLETILRNKGIEILDSETEIVDGVIIAHLEVTDTDAEIYLGDVADEVAETLQGYDVDYDEPEDDEEDKVVFIDFYFVPVLTTESCTAPTVEEEPTTPATETPAEVVPEGTAKVTESVEDMVESFAGGMDNIRCKINPAFIKQGQVIYDADDHTVFTALTESVACDGGFSLAVEIQNSANQDLADLASGAEINLGATGKYFLLKNNPVK